MTECRGAGVGGVFSVDERGDECVGGVGSREGGVAGFSAGGNKSNSFSLLYKTNMAIIHSYSISKLSFRN